MKRIAAAFNRQPSKKLVPFITAGDPDIEETLQIMETLVASGADIIELGVPFSDPMADGPVIQRASDRALAQGVGLSDIFRVTARFREADKTTPLVLMGYLNPIEHMGIEAFAAAAQQAGVDGVLIVDLPPEESESVVTIFKQHQLALIFLISPTTAVERIQKIAAQASGYLYYVSLRGVTGASHLDLEEIGVKIDQIRSHTDLPILVGFGIKNAEMAKKVASKADGVVIGSALVETIERSLSSASARTAGSEGSSARHEAVANLVSSMRSVLA